VPLSTSSSDSRVPDLNYRRQWIIVLTLAFACLATMEYCWRNKGFEPSPSDTKELWSYWRDKIYTENGRKKIVLIGASRVQLGIVPEVLQAELPDYDVVNLSVNAHTGYATFADITNDPKFDGILIFSTDPQRLTDKNNSNQKKWCKYYRNNFKSTLNNKTNLSCGVILQNIFCSLGTNNTPKFIISRIIDGSWPDPYVSMRFNRYRPAFYSKLPVSKLETKLERYNNILKDNSLRKPGISLPQFKQIVQIKLTPSVDRLNERGGKVVFLKMPESGKGWKVRSDKYPIDYWNVIEKNCDALVIHFQKYTGLSNFNCPDGSHLEYTDAVKFTEELASILKNELFNRSNILSAKPVTP
jgi:hypothetical protein